MAKMRILLDSNVALDAILKREAWLPQSLALLEAHEKGQVEAFLSANSVTDIYYIVQRHVDRVTAKTSVAWCLATFKIAPVTGEMLKNAIRLSGKDFEDNVQIACVNELGLDGIVTRDSVGFRAAGVPVYTPETLLAELIRRE